MSKIQHLTHNVLDAYAYDCWVPRITYLISLAVTLEQNWSEIAQTTISSSCIVKKNEHIYVDNSNSQTNAFNPENVSI